MKIEPITIPVKESTKEKKVIKKKTRTIEKEIKKEVKETPKEVKEVTITKEVTKTKPKKFFQKPKLIKSTETKVEKITKPKEEITKTETVEIKKPAKPIEEDLDWTDEEISEFKEEQANWKKGPMQESPEKIEKMSKEEAEWNKGPKPSTSTPPKPQYAFQPTDEEVELMKEFESQEREKKILKPTREEEELMEEIREPDLKRELKPTNEEWGYMKKEGLIKEEANNRTKTGIEGIDDLTKGGLPSNKAIAVVGGPGTGKSILLMQFLINGAKSYNEPGIYITFEEEVNELKENYKSFNFNIKELEKKGMLKIVHYSPMKIKRFVKNMDVTLRDLIKSMNAKRVVIDSLSAFTLLYTNEGEQREGLFNLFQTLKELGVTTLLSTESWREPTITKSGVIEFIADGVIMMYNLKIGDTRVRAIEVLKMRGIEHEMRISPFKITNEGIKIFTEEEVFGARRKDYDTF